MMFWAGVLLGVVAFGVIEWVVLRVGFRALIKDGEIVLGVYDRKRDQWKITRKFHQYAAAIDSRRHSRPDSVKYID